MIEGIVVRINDNKTVKVAIVEILKHQLYGKFIRRKKEFLCQFDISDIDLHEGDRVLIKPCRPFSKMKKHIVVKKVVI